MGRKVAKNVARNKKKYWRKISTQDIEDKLEDIRVQEITGGRRADQPDHVLYHIDTERPLGSTSPKDEVPVKTRKQRAALDLNNLNSYKILQPHSSVPPICIDSVEQPRPSSKATKRLLETQQIAEKRRAARKKHQRAKEQRSAAEEKNALDKADRVILDDPTVLPTYDLWNVKDEKKEKVRDLVGSKMASYMEQIYQTYDWEVPKHIVKKPSKLPAIEKPLAGMSYNPTFDDHQELLRKAVEVEMEKVRKETKLQNSLPAPVLQHQTKELKKSWMKEMASGLFDDDTTKGDGEEEKSRLTTVSVGKPVKIETKTSQQRNKEKIRKKQDALAKAAKEKRIRDTQLFRMKSIRKEIQGETAKLNERQEKRHVEHEKRQHFGTKKFGRYKYEEADLDLNLSEEITGNLRTMKTEGNILHDRFKSFQKRNIIESRIRAKPTKTKMKKYEKRSVREVGEAYRPK